MFVHVRSGDMWTILLSILAIVSNVVTIKDLSISSTVACQIKLKILDCSNRGLTEIPDFSTVSSDYRGIREVNLSNNAITELDLQRLDCFSRLRKLSLNNNKLQWIYNDGNSLNRLANLYIDNNELTEIPNLRNLRILSMRKNRIKTIRNDTFRGMNRLEEIYLFDGRAKTFVDMDAFTEQEKTSTINVEIGAFRNMPSLRSLQLHSFDVNIKSFPDLTGTKSLKELTLCGVENLKFPVDFCVQQRSLQEIGIGLSTMDVFPSLNKCSNLHNIDFAQNTIGEIGENSFSGLQHVNLIEIFQNQNTVSKIHPNAFSNLPSLSELDLSHFPLGSFPNLQGTNNLRTLKLQYCRIDSIPEDFCSHMPKLTNLDLTQNNLRSLPSLSKCSELQILDLFSNRLTSLTDQFKGLKKLEFIKLEDNHLRTIPESLFGSTKRLEALHLAKNLINYIHPKAFTNISNLHVLDVSHNLLKHLPSAGLQSVSRIIANGNHDMIHFPTQQELPHAKRLTLDYHYHCCFFLKRVQQIHHKFVSRELNANSKWNIVGDGDDDFDGRSLISRYKNASKKALSETNDEMDPFVRILKELNNHTVLFVDKPPDDEQATIHQVFTEEDAYCTPTPNEFYPCEDLMGREWLRVCVWIVFFLALFGNVAVLFVMFSNYSKLDVPRFLVLNLAMADLCLGVYLGFLAFVDIKTIGDFRSHALNWQFSGSCKFAGFLAVFSSELSVYTLTTITIERFLTIKNSMYVDKRLTKNQAFLIMVFGWLFSMFIATLPLIEGEVKFNDYTKYSVCLPFETDTLTSRIYLMFLLGLNLLAFVIILFCYIKIYLFISNSQAWNSGDSRVARRMAILVFTDFLCWFPIALVALSAVFKNPFITDLWVSKVITIFIFPLNACANPFLYAIFTKQFRKDIVSATRHVRDKVTNRREIRKSLLKLPIKGSLTYSTSVRRESSCSFLFGRRHSSKPDNESKQYTRTTPMMQPSFQQSFEEPDEEDYQERLTTV